MLEKKSAAVSSVPEKMVQNPAPASVGIAKIDDAKIATTARTIANENRIVCEDVIMVMALEQIIFAMPADCNALAARSAVIKTVLDFRRIESSRSMQFGSKCVPRLVTVLMSQSLLLPKTTPLKAPGSHPSPSIGASTSDYVFASSFSYISQFIVITDADQHPDPNARSEFPFCTSRQENIGGVGLGNARYARRPITTQINVRDCCSFVDEPEPLDRKYAHG
ncbi:hypothetical protein DFJ58DRAFT_890762 [Suillus subalutaceus]|uniref:uncharacterized protein n=1 Tax=Suillus subalutaceus TaxID=48586 RepID=UPI001B8871EF|nr:uncharacterized protein DFJ58DRAFT_890762 [Suillus subalutaceus]KAG1848328.1 hypothetical protein DFJ58DRAFT_890762 [Suillus subalutaceus]